MAIWTGHGSGYYGNDFTQIPSGGGAFKFSEAPTVPGVYAGSCPGDPNCPGRETDRSGTTGWTEVAKEIAVTASSALITKYLAKPGTPGEKTVIVRDKGNFGSVAEPIPDSFWGTVNGIDPRPGRESTKETSAGPALFADPKVIAVLAVAVIGFALFAARRK